MELELEVVMVRGVLSSFADDVMKTVTNPKRMRDVEAYRPYLRKNRMDGMNIGLVDSGTTQTQRN
jgi:hypothetical protein